MPALGITGGIATGKSTFSRALAGMLSAELFDADQCAHDLLRHDPGVQEAIVTAFGREVLNSAGEPDRAALRQRVFANPAERRTLEAILHPAITQSWCARAQAARAGKNFLCVDLPLLYETGVETHFDRVIVVACSAATQDQRMREGRGLDGALAAQMLAAQLDLNEKISRGNHLIWNDSTPARLERQASLLANWLRQRYGQ